MVVACRRASIAAAWRPAATALSPAASRSASRCREARSDAAAARVARKPAVASAHRHARAHTCRCASSATIGGLQAGQFPKRRAVRLPHDAQAGMGSGARRLLRVTRRQSAEVRRRSVNLPTRSASRRDGQASLARRRALWPSTTHTGLRSDTKRMRPSVDARTYGALCHLFDIKQIVAFA